MCPKISKHILILVSIVIIACMLFACEEKPKEGIFLETAIYNMAVGEIVTITDEDVKMSLDNDNVAIIGKSIKALKHGKSKVTLRRGNVSRVVEVNVYDAVVTQSGMNKASYFDSVQAALRSVKAHDVIYLENGKYDEYVTIDKDITLIGSEKVYLKGIEVVNDASLTIENVAFYSREYPDADFAMIKVYSGGSLVARSCDFLVDKKSDTKEDRHGGHAIYVCANSRLVDIDDCEITGFFEGIKIASTSGEIYIKSSNFQHVNVGIIIDIIDYQQDLPANKNAVGEVKDNVYSDVVKEVEFLYAGPSYEGGLIIEKHDKL